MRGAHLAFLIAVVLLVGLAAEATMGAVSRDAATPTAQALFKKNCGACHTMKAAGTKGSIGPNLDRLKPSQARVARQVRNGGGAMPSFKGRLSTAQITAIAKYVAAKT